MNVIEGQANRKKKFSLIFYSLTFNNILNIIVMLILVGVTINVALNGGIFRQATEATKKTEKGLFLEQIIEMAVYDETGIIVDETFIKVKNSKLDLVEIIKEPETEAIFKVKGKYGTYGYKITKNEITTYDKESRADLSFTLNELTAHVIEYLKDTDEEFAKMTNDDLIELLGEDLVSTDYQGICIPMASTLFWPVVGENLAGMYGMIGENEFSTLTISTDSPTVFTEYKGKEVTSENVFVFMTIEDEVIIEFGDKNLNAILTPTEEGVKLDENLLSYSEFLDAYGDIKFYFDDSEEIAKMEDYYFTLNDLIENIENQDSEINIGSAELISGQDSTIINVSSDTLWKTVGKSFSGQYGVDLSNCRLIKSLSTNEEEQSNNFKFYHKDVDNITGNGFTFIDNMEYGMYLVLWDENGAIIDNASEIESLLNKYGNVKFYFDGSKVAKQSFILETDLINNIALNNSSSIIYEGEYENTLCVTNSNYALPDSITITMNGEILDEGLNQYSYDSSTGKITIPNVTGKVKITAEGEYTIATIRYYCENVNYEHIGTLQKGEEYTNTFTPNNDNSLPDSIKVVKNGQELNAGIDYIWNSTTGSLYISSVDADISIYVSVRGNYLGRYILIGDTLWRVLYDEGDKTEGAQIVSNNVYEKIELEDDGTSNYLTRTLNTVAAENVQSIIDDNRIVSAARSTGTNPLSSSVEFYSDYTRGETVDDMVQIYNIGNYMYKTTNMDSYWLASHDPGSTSFGFAYGSGYGSSTFYMDSTYGNSAYGVRPVIILCPNVLTKLAEYSHAGGTVSSNAWNLDEYITSLNN